VGIKRRGGAAINFPLQRLYGNKGGKEENCILCTLVGIKRRGGAAIKVVLAKNMRHRSDSRV